jgi:protein TonB
MNRREPPQLSVVSAAGAADDADELICLTTLMMVAPRREGRWPVTPPQPLAPRRKGFAYALALHAGALAVIIVLAHARLPVRRDEARVIAVTVETTPQGNAQVNTPKPPVVPPTPRPVAMARAAPLLPPPPPPPPMPAFSRTPHAAPLFAERPPVPPTPAPVSLPQRVTPLAAPPLLVRGTRAPGHKIGPMVVLANHPAAPDAGNEVPVYSLVTRAMGEQGNVGLLILIAADGAVLSVQVVSSSGYARLDDAARTAALTWHFSPAVRDGVPVQSQFPYTVRFLLQ